jgi:hypothetical protein
VKATGLNEGELSVSEAAVRDIVRYYTREAGVRALGLTDEAWPLTARPNPFIPIAAQKKAGIPQASAEASRCFT